MKKRYKLINISSCLLFMLSSLTFVQATTQDTTLDQDPTIVDIRDQANEFENEGSGFEDSQSFVSNPRLRSMESSSYSRNGNYMIWAIQDKSLYADSYGNNEIAIIPAGEVMKGTKRYGEFVYVSSSKGAGWVYVNNNLSKLTETDTINEMFQSYVETTMYTQPFLSGSFRTTRKIPAGIYKATKRASYFVYITNGSYSGWITTQYSDSGYNIGKSGGTYLSSIEKLSATSIDGIPVKQKIIPKINDNARPGSQMIPKYVTIHNTDNSSAGANALAHATLQYNGYNASWHFQVDDKEIYQSVPMNEIAYHAGDGNTMGNASTIAIEICENDKGIYYAAAEKNAAKLTARILFENNLPATAVKLHKDWSGKQCAHNILNLTNKSMGWTNFKALVQSEYDKLGANIKMSTSYAKIEAFQTYQLSAAFMPTTTTNKALTWTSSNTDVASVNASGLVYTKNVGTTTITAKNANGKTTSARIDVSAASVSLNRTSGSIYKGTSLTLTSQPYPASQITWKSDNPSVATVTSGGVIKAIAAGKTYIRASVNGKSAACEITVLNPVLKLNRSTLTVYKGYTGSLSATTAPATGIVTWTSSNSSVASVSSTGVVKGISAGTATICASWNGLKVSATITVKNPSISLSSTSRTVYRGYSSTLKATPYPSTATVKWSSSNTSIATVSSTGLITGRGNGTAYIYATIAGAKVSCKVYVKTGSLTLNRTSLSAYTGIFGYRLYATASPSNASVTWKSSNTLIATVNSSGLVVGKKAGTVTISASIYGVTRTCRVTFVKTSRPVKSVYLNASSLSFNNIRGYQLKATYNPSTPTIAKVSWSTSNSSIASVSSNGYVSAKRKGTCYITATAHNGVKRTILVTVYK